MCRSKFAALCIHRLQQQQAQQADAAHSRATAYRRNAASVGIFFYHARQRHFMQKMVLLLECFFVILLKLTFCLADCKKFWQAGKHTYTVILWRMQFHALTHLATKCGMAELN